jgi:hypothetical protein
MRGGGAQVTTEFLAEWTDPDTAMEAVGNSLGVFDHVPSAIAALHGESPLRNALYEVLLRLVDGGALETRACADGRFAFRWRAELATMPPVTANGLVASHAGPSTPPMTPPADAAPAPVEARASEAALEPPAVPRRPIGRRLAAQWAPLLLPSISCILVLLAFVWLDQSVALVIAAAMAVVGVIGVVRRVQLAAFWTVGLVIAGLLLRFS